MGELSTSHIENTWAYLKASLKNIYNIIPKSNYVYFIRECEFRINIHKKNDNEKMNIFEKILKYVFDLNQYDFYDEEEIIAYDNYDY